ncbi:MAG: hypothetical protein B5M51_08115 [Anaerolinea sp. 4484_236]|nr:MAG: hypothetical protein B5M51_08115 [Anaerolinea sp. 4484_236]OQY31278.1 MAG: hypothetical protein B6243_08690 [Anaerolineaceae bacterium 4572_5.2]RLD04144.1 MAG: hypothetical protein DRI56_11615 [Chloroflexota bacterium]
MNFKKILLFVLVITVAVFAGWGLNAKAHSPHQEDNPGDEPNKADIPIDEQVGNTLGIIWGGIAIILAIGAGVGVSYLRSKNEQTQAFEHGKSGNEPI